MTAQQILQSTSAPKGLTSVIMGVSNGDYSVFPHQKGIDAGYEQAIAEVAKYQKAIDECKSDWAYWSILGDLEYWKAVVNILDAAKIAGENPLPDIPLPRTDGVVMDNIASLSDFGEKILAQTRKMYTPKTPAP